MDDVFALCSFKTPLEGSTGALRAILGAGMPVNIKYGELRHSAEFDPQSGLLHLICEYVDTSEQMKVALVMVDILFEFGANWLLLDGQNRTPGCIAFSRAKHELYQKFVRAGARTEVVLQSLLESNSDNDRAEANSEDATIKSLEGHNKTFLGDKLKYDKHSLQTTESDGVMMDWETPIMERSAALITKAGGSVLNIGFGMGIVDGFIQKHNPKKHYIVEAHPDVLRRMKQTGWYDKPNVVVLEGTWKKVLPKLVDEHIHLDGIYYDTFSEYYKDMLELFDMVVGLLNFDGVFSYFNGLGADRQVCYDVYKEVAGYNLQDYGLQLRFEALPVSIAASEWNNIKRAYFKLNEYALPIVTFKDQLEEEEGELLKCSK